jgi:O-antigen/teichoic acid export membrane protein
LIKKIIDNFLKSELQVKIANGVLWSFFGTLISRGFLFLTMILITNTVSLKEFGEIGIIKSIIVTFSLFSVASFGVTATRYISIYKGKDLNKVSKILSLTYLSTFIISVLIFLIINIFSKQFATHLINNESFLIETLLISIAIFFSALNGFQNGALVGFEKFKSIAIVNIVNGVLAIPILYFSTIFYGVIGYCSGMAILFFLLFIFSSYFLNNAKKEAGIRYGLKGVKEELSVIKKFSVPSFLGGFIVSPTILICNSILVKSDNGFVNMAIYEAAFNFSIVAMTFNSMIGQVIYPFAVRLFNKNNNKFNFFNLNAPWLIGVFLSLFLIFLPDIFSMIFDEKYHNIKMYNTVSCIAIFIIFISHRQGISRNLAAINKMWYSFFDNFIWSILAVLFTYFLVYEGSLGRALAFIGAYFVNSFIVLPFYVNKKVFNKDFIYSRESILIWLLVLISFTTIFLNLDLFCRLLLLLTSLLLLSFISIKWFLRLSKSKEA